MTLFTPATTDDAESGWLRIPQPRLSTPGMVALLGTANAICPFAIDMYTPAVPSLPTYFSTSEAMVNLTLVGFYLFYSIGMLVFGPICDRTGRKPILVGGMGLFTLGSLLCALAWSIETLILFRFVQALGAGAVCAVSTAIIKDCFRPHRRTQLLSLLQVLMVIGPVVAPLLGGLILQFASWHANFATLAIIGALCTALTLLFSESLPVNQRVAGGLANSLARMGKVARNRSFMVLLLVMAMFSVPYMAYVAAASYVYVDGFHVSEQTYSYYFAATAAISACGPLIYLAASKRVSDRLFTHLIILICLVVAVALILFGHGSIWVFFACFAAFILFEATIRPYMTNILLSQQDEDAGSASSLINFIANFFGVLGMGIVSAFAADYVLGMGIIMLASMAAAGGLWLYLLRSGRTDIRELRR